MILKKMKTSLLTILLSLLLPLTTFAYSSNLVLGGDNIGINISYSGILVVGIYKIGDQDPANQAGLKKGDIITSVNNTKVNSINNLVEIINNDSDKNIVIDYTRDKKNNQTNLQLYQDDTGTLKTGLYVKDSVTGIGTLTYVDPNTRIYGALGHEIAEQSTGQILEIKNGKIFESSVTGVNPSKDGTPGEKQATYYNTKVDGDIKENTTQGIFGKYTKELKENKKYKVASTNDIKEGTAYLHTVLDGNKVEPYTINIIQINKTDQKNKNFVFKITDEKLLNKTGGIIQGMSGSPITQGDYIIGAVTHVVVDDVTKGYGIFITNMLEESEN